MASLLVPAALALATSLAVTPAAAENKIPAELLRLTMPRPPALEPAVAFWRAVFGRYGRHEVLIHAIDYPHKVFTVLDFRGAAARMSARELANHQRQRINETMTRINEHLEALADAGGNPKGMNAEAQAIHALFADIDRDDLFRQLHGRVRAQHGVAERTASGLQRAGRYLPYIENVFAEEGLPLALTRLPMVESSFDSRAYSKVGAAGMWQFMPASARHYMRLDHMVDDRRDPWRSTAAAAAHLRDDFEMLQDWPLAVTAYNFGRHGIRRALEKIEGESLTDMLARYDHPRFGFASRNFYASFLGALDVEQERHRYFGPLAPAEPPAAFDAVRLQHYLDWNTLQQMSGWDADTFAAHNPSYGEMVRDGQLRVPAGHVIRIAPNRREAFASSYANLDASLRHERQRDAFLAHRVAPGETLSHIARRYDTSAAHLLSLNGIRDARRLRSGQSIRVPITANTRAVAAVETRPRISDTQQHRVAAGDTLSAIAQRHRTSVAQLKAINDISDARSLRAGQTLQLPGGAREYTVAQGDSLWRVAQRFDTSIDALRTANRLTSDRLMPGETLRIPGSGATGGVVRHRVTPGETLSAIAQRHGIGLDVLVAHNALRDSDSIRAGSEIEIPMY